MPGCQDFRDSPGGRVLIELADRALAEMQAMAARGEPAVAAIDAAVADALGRLRLAATVPSEVGKAPRSPVGPDGDRLVGAARLSRELMAGRACTHKARAGTARAQ